jgi:hypothetical protein
MDQENLTIHLEKANTLDKLLSKEQRKKVVNLKITGHIGKKDFDNVLDDMCDVDLIYKNYDDEDEEGIPDYKNAYPLRNLDMGEAVFTDGDILPDFGFYTQLESIILPQGIKSITDEYDTGSALSNSQRLHTVVFPESTKSLGGLEGCTKLKNLVFPDTIEVIQDYAFFYCESLKSIRIPASVKEIYGTAFAHSGIEAFEIDENNPYFTLVDGALFTKDLTELVAFPPKSHKKEYTIPPTTKIIGEGAFISSELHYINIPDSVTSIEGWAFEDSKLRSLEMPDSVTEIGILLCRWCNDLEHLKLSNSLTDIPDQTFSSCDKLKKITIPPSVKRMDLTNIFWSTHLETIELNEGLEEIYLDGPGDANTCAKHYSKKLRIVNWPKSLRKYPNQILHLREK